MSDNKIITGVRQAVAFAKSQQADDDYDDRTFDWGALVNATIKSAKDALARRWPHEMSDGYMRPTVFLEAEDGAGDPVVSCTVSLHDGGKCWARCGKALFVFDGMRTIENDEFLDELAKALWFAKGKKPWHGERGRGRERDMLERLREHIEFL